MGSQKNVALESLESFGAASTVARLVELVCNGQLSELVGMRAETKAPCPESFGRGRKEVKIWRFQFGSEEVEVKVSSNDIVIQSGRRGLDFWGLEERHPGLPTDLLFPAALAAVLFGEWTDFEKRVCGFVKKHGYELRFGSFHESITYLDVVWPWAPVRPETTFPPVLKKEVFEPFVEALGIERVKGVFAA